MKRNLYVITIALTLGAVFAIYIFENQELSTMPAVVTSGKVYYFQLAMFENEANAKTYLENIEYGIIKKESDFYYIYGALYSNEYLVEKLKNYYTLNNISYVVKENIIGDEDFQELLSYENILLQSDNMEVILRSNQIILENIVLSI